LIIVICKEFRRSNPLPTGSGFLVAIGTAHANDEAALLRFGGKTGEEHGIGSEASVAV
jgi:hypothetical protein